LKTCFLSWLFVLEIDWRGPEVVETGERKGESAEEGNFALKAFDEGRRPKGGEGERTEEVGEAHMRAGAFLGSTFKEIA